MVMDAILSSKVQQLLYVTMLLVLQMETLVDKTFTTGFGMTNEGIKIKWHHAPVTVYINYQEKNYTLLLAMFNLLHCSMNQKSTSATKIATMKNTDNSGYER